MNFEQARFNMVEQQIRPWDVLDQRVLDVISSTPREDFVPAEYRQLAFSDTQLPIGHNQVMMRPNMEGRMLQALAIRPSDIILEVGTGSGYISACLAQLGKHVYTVDIHPEFTHSAEAKLSARRIDNVTFCTGDASQVWDQLHQYDVIAITGSVPEIPPRHKEALLDGGRLFVIVGNPGMPVMEAVLLTRTGQNQWAHKSLFETTLPALIHATKAPQFVF